MNIGGVSNPIREYELRGRRTANATSAAQNFEEQIVRESASQSAAASVPAAANVPASATISGADYLKLQQESAAANSPEAKSAAEHKALIAASDNTTSERAAAKPEAAPAGDAEKASSIPAMPDFSNMSDSQKLSALRQLHEQTDYTGMTNAEKYKLMNDRFEAAFPNLQAILSGIYGPLGTNYADFDPNYRPALPERIANERDHQWRELELGGEKKVNPLHKEAYYSGMTDEEIIAAISNKYSGGTIADRAATLRELRMVGLDNGVAGQALDAMRQSLLSNVRGERVYGAMNLYPKNAMEYSRLSALIGGTQMSWGAFGSAILSVSYQDAADSLNADVALQQHENFQEKWNELLEQLMAVGSEHSKNHSLSADEYRMEERRKEPGQTTAEE